MPPPLPTPAPGPAAGGTTPPPPDAAPPPVTIDTPRPPRDLAPIAERALFAMVAAFSAAGTLALIHSRALAIPAAVIVAATTFAYLHLRDRVRWRRPIDRLTADLRNATEGHAAARTLLDTTGRLAPLANAAYDAIALGKEHRGQAAHLRRVLPDTVARKTSELVHQIGVMRRRSELDALTGLGNRRALETALPAVALDTEEFSLLMIDVDYFKLLNDTLGHPGGDEFLRQLGSLIRSSLRPTDHGFRPGGDEFVILLPDTGPADADALASRLADLTDGLARPLRLAKPPRLSIGRASASDLPGHLGPDTPKAVTALADERLYAIKRARKSLRVA